MRKGLQSRLKTLALMIGALALCAPLWSDVPASSSGANSKKMCYCDCDAKSGAAMCMHMCELPKYENRSWATSCHKKQDNDSTAPSAAPGARSTKDNGVQQARR